jgi:hypothetical protein
MPPSLEIDDELIEELGGVSRSRVTLQFLPAEQTGGRRFRDVREKHLPATRKLHPFLASLVYYYFPVERLTLYSLPISRSTTVVFGPLAIGTPYRSPSYQLAPP